MHRLVHLFGGEWDEHRNLSSRLDYLEAFSDRWDFRRGVERLDATPVSLGSTDEELVRTAASDLGLTVAIHPEREAYDHIVILGGVALSCRLRTEFAAELVLRRQIRADDVTLLGAARPIPDNERTDAESFAPGAVTEFDMMNAAAESAFDLNDGYDEAARGNESANLASVVRRYRRPGPPAIYSLCAPSSDPGRRANTEDTYAFMADVLGLAPGQSILICTSQIYFPFHLFGAMRMLALPYEVEVEVVGFPVERASGPGALRGVNNLLQEVRSGIQAAVRLKGALDSLPE